MDTSKTLKLDNVRLMVANRKVATGTLCVTATHLIFVDPEGSREAWILYSHILSLERLPLTAAGAPLKIKCKTFRTVTFVVARERDCADLYELLTEFSNPEKLEDLYAFNYKPHAQDTLTRQAGWALFDISSEYSRMNIPNNEWVHTTINVDYKICETYPEHLFVPRSASNAVLVGSSKFRSRRRLPALSYFHKETKAAICRCSQPLAGLNARCPEDEALIQAVLKSTPDSKFIYIVDTRPKLNALANRAAGKGYESTDFYDNVKFQFVGIENIHVMRQSLQKLIEGCEASRNSVSAFLSGQESSGWTKHIKAILDTSVFIVKAIVEEKVSVIVHCSDGWDRTAQTCSLAGIILDPYYRTIHGFQVLIEKEWLSFGHKFTDRCGFLQSEVKETSPVFLQFLECTWQLLEQFPCDFQFNERFLICLHDHAHSCQFGTFLGNCERERRELKISEKTYSLWGYMWQNISDYINPLHREQNDHYLFPDTSPQKLKFWRSMYNRFDNDVHPREIVRDSLSSLIDHNDSLQDHIKLLQSRMEMFKTLLRPSEPKQGDNPNPEGLRCAGGESRDTPSLPRNGAHSPLPGNQDVTNGEPAIEGDETSKEEKPHGDATADSTGFFQGISRDLKRQGITPDDLFTVLPPFAMDWDSTRDVSQCVLCAKPIDLLSRKYHCWNCGKVFCKACIKQQCSLPGHYSENLVPVCKKCHSILSRP